MSFGWGGFAGAPMPSRFDEQYHCYSVAYADKAHLEGGDKILLPPSAFDTLARLQVDYPMLFRLSNSQKGTMTHSGVLEFTAEEGSCYIPFWMMQNLLIEEGSVISVTNVSLPKASFVKLQPQHVDFLEITNPRAVLEHALRNFSCVTKGDVICVPHNSKNYHFELKEVKPQDAACIIETDCNVDFDAPIGYKEPEKTKPQDISGSIGGSSSGRNSECPSPTPSSMSGTTTGSAKDVTDSESTKPPGIRIVDGKILRPDEESMSSYGENSTSKVTDGGSTLLAPKTGVTGVQKNAAIAVKAPQVSYWAVNAGDGARLDGKTPTKLKDKEGNELDIRQLRAEAAAKRAAALAAASTKSMPTAGTTVSGEATTAKDDQSVATSASSSSAAPVSKRKSRIGNKYSRLKQSGGFAFQGSSNKF